MNISKTISEGINILKQNEIRNPQLDAEILLSKLIKKDKNFAKLWKQGEQNRKDIDAYLKKVTKGTKLTRKQQDAFDKGKFPF